MCDQYVEREDQDKEIFTRKRQEKRISVLTPFKKARRSSDNEL